MDKFTTHINEAFSNEGDDLSWLSKHLNDGTGRIVTASYIQIATTKIEEFIDCLKEDFVGCSVDVNMSVEFRICDIEIIDRTHSTNKVNILFGLSAAGDSGKSYFSMISTPQICTKVHTAVKSVITQELDNDYNINIAYFNIGAQGINSIDICKKASDFDYVRNDLYPRIDVTDMVKQYVAGRENILVLTGEPGTGKTSLIKMIMREYANINKCNISPAYVKDEDLIKDPVFWTYMANKEAPMLILDDLDNSLGERSEGHDDSFVNQLLSFSDGIFDHKTKIIITTNRPMASVDSAIIRPGRCFDILCMPLLSREEAEHLWMNSYELSETSFNASFGNRETISQALLCSEYDRVTSDFPKSYLHDQSISTRKKYIS